jgi:lysyl-tRNA synthetase class 2
VQTGNSASRQVLQQRAVLLGSIRDFFARRGVLEVTTPLISPTANPDPAIQPVEAKGITGGYLRTSAEFDMKRLLADGSGDIYELGPVFRAGEKGKTHSPEFTMLEWYRTGWTYGQLMNEVSELLHEVSPGKFSGWAQQIFTYVELFQKYTGMNPHSASLSQLESRFSTETGSPDGMSRNDWLDLALATVIQPSLPERTFTYVHEYPADQAALAKIRPGSPAISERFELYLGRLELANGYQELTDGQEQSSRFQVQNKQRCELGLPELPIDAALLAAMDRGLPECTGVALGVDRLLMVILDIEDINDVLTLVN